MCRWRRRQTPRHLWLINYIRRANLHKHAHFVISFPWSFPSRSMPQSSSDFLGSDPFHETFRPLFRRLASFPLVLGCSRPLIGADTESSEVVQETPHPLLFMLLPRSLRRPPVLRTPRTSTVPYCSLAFRRDQLLLWGLPLVVPSQAQSLHYQHGRPSPKPSQERK